MEYLIIFIAFWLAFFGWYLYGINKLTNTVNSWDLNSAHNPDNNSAHHKSNSESDLNTFKKSNGTTLIITSLMIVAYYFFKLN